MTDLGIQSHYSYSHQHRKKTFDADEDRYISFTDQLFTGVAYVIGNKIELTPSVEQVTGFLNYEIATIDQWFERVFPGCSEQIRELYFLDKHHGFKVPRIVQITRKTGESRWVQFSAYVRRDLEIWMLQDMTEALRLETILNSNLQRMRAFVESMPSAVAMLDKELRMQACSDQWLQSYGFEAKDIRGKRLFDLFPEMTESWRSHFFRALAGEMQKNDEDFIDKEGQRLWFKWELRPWYDGSRIGGVIVFYENITPYKVTQERLLHSSKMASLGEMSSSIAHEINNPLSIIVGRAHQLKDLSERNKLQESDPAKFSDVILKSANRISKIVKGLRNFSREGTSDPFQIVSLNQLYQDVLEICQSRLYHHEVQIEWSEIPTEWNVEVRPSEIEQVFLNLISNSFDSIVPSDETERPQSRQERWIRIETERTKTHYVIRFVDSGPGVPVYVREKIFLPFFTTKEVGKGTGLGLSISKGLIESHGGTLDLDITAANTTFVVALPRPHAK